MRSLPLRRRVGRLLGQWTLLGMAALAGLGLLAAHQLREQAIERQVLLAESWAGFVDEVLAHTFRDLQRLARRAEVLDAPTLAAMRDFRFESPFRRAVMILDETGAVILADPVGSEPVCDELPRGRETVTSFVEREDGGCLAVLLPYRVGNRTLRIVAELEPRETSLAELVGSPARSLGTSVIDEDGVVVLTTEPAALHRKVPVAAATATTGRTVGAVRVDPSASCVTCDGPGGERALRVTVPLRNAPWSVLIEEPVTAAFADRRHLLVALGVLLSALAGLGIVVTQALGRSLVDPISELSRRAEKMRAGDLSAPFVAHGDQEVRVLAATLEQARERLAGHLEQLRQVNETLEQRVTERTAEAKRLVRRLLDAGEEERKRIARELHDEISQLLTVVGLSIEQLAHDPAALDSTREALTKAQDELRRIVTDLRPTILDDLGLASAVRWYARNHLSRRGIDVYLAIDDGQRLPPEVEISAFRIFQEILTNVLRHSKARHAAVECYATEKLFELVVEDDGVGFDPAEATAGAGLVGMRERASLVGGELVIDSEPGSGTTVRLTVPLEQR